MMMNSRPLTRPAVEPPGQAKIAAIARKQEDVMVNDQLIVRHKAGVRLAHWTLAVLFFLATLVGFVIYTPFFFGAGLSIRRRRYGAISAPVVCARLRHWRGVSVRPLARANEERARRSGVAKKFQSLYAI